jgi:hypothetical protein
MGCFGTTDFDNNSRLITLSAITISGLHCISKYQILRQSVQLVHADGRTDGRRAMAKLIVAFRNFENVPKN